MIEVIVLFAVLFLIWIIWQYLNARQFNQFQRELLNEIKPQLVDAIKLELEENRSELTPNSDAHIEATIHFWTAHKVRILQGALKYEIFDETWLEKPQNKRNAQHLLHVEQAFRV